MLFSPLNFALNKVLATDADSRSGLNRFSGRSIHINITDLQRSVLVHFVDEQIELSDGQDQTADLMIAAASSDLLKVARHPDNLFSAQIKILGDVQFAKQLQDWLQAFDFDWEAELAKVTGDTLAYPIAQGLRQGFSWMVESANSVQLSMAEYLREEARLLPDKAETDLFMQQVDSLQADMDRLEARIARLSNKSEQSS